MNKTITAGILALGVGSAQANIITPKTAEFLQYFSNVGTNICIQAGKTSEECSKILYSIGYENAQKAHQECITSESPTPDEIICLNEAIRTNLTQSLDNIMDMLGEDEGISI